MVAELEVDRRGTAGVDVGRPRAEIVVDVAIAEARDDRALLRQEDVAELRVGDGRAEHVAAAIVVGVRVIRRERDGQVAEVAAELALDPPALVAVDRLAVEHVARVAVVIAVIAADPRGNVLAERAGEVGGRADFVLVEIGDRGVGREHGARRAGDDVERARRGVLAEQRALRPAEHFDPVDVGEVLRRHPRAAVDDAVDDRRHARLRARGEGLRPDPADRDGRVDVGGAALEGQRRDEPVERFRAVDVAAAERLRADDADRDGDGLEIFRAALRGDDDVVARHRLRDGLLGGGFLDGRGRGGRGLRLRGGRDQRGGERGGSGCEVKARACGGVHVSVLPGACAGFCPSDCCRLDLLDQNSGKFVKWLDQFCDNAVEPLCEARA